MDRAETPDEDIGLQSGWNLVLSGETDIDDHHGIMTMILSMTIININDKYLALIWSYGVLTGRPPQKIKKSRQG